MEKKRSALILGATGLIGSHLLRFLQDQVQYGKILHPRRSEVDFFTLENYPELFEGIDDVFCAIGTTQKKAKTQEIFRSIDYGIPLKAAQLAKKAGVSQFLLVSSVGANPESPIFYNKVKGELERDLRLPENAPPGIHIFRPSLLLGVRSEFRFGESVSTPFAKLISPVLGLTSSLAKYRPIEAEMVARVMIRVAIAGQQPRQGIFIYEGVDLQR